MIVVDYIRKIGAYSIMFEHSLHSFNLYIWWDRLCVLFWVEKVHQMKFINISKKSLKYAPIIMPNNFRILYSYHMPFPN